MATEHLDEGTIHAWLDEALGAAQAASVSAHVASCAACQGAVAEARGLIAGSSRVLRALDADVDSASPGQVRPWGAPPAKAPPAEGLSLWRMLRVTPARAALAATLLVALGVTLTHDWVATESELSEFKTSATLTTDSATPAAPAAPKDALLDSAISRNIAQAVPPRTVRAAPGPVVEVPALAPAPSAMPAEPEAGLRVAEARRARDAMRDTAAAEADVAATDARTASRAVARQVPGRKSVDLPVRADAPLAERALAGAAAGLAGAECFRVDGAARWSGVTLPVVVRLEPLSGADGAAVLVGVAGDSGDVKARWRREGADIVRVELQQPGFAGTLTLAGSGQLRAGTVHDGAVEMGIAAGAAAAAAPAAPPAGNARTTVRRAPTRQVPVAQAPAGEMMAVTAQRVSCPPR